MKKAILGRSGMGKVVFEMVPTAAERGAAGLRAEARKVRQLFVKSGIEQRVDSVLIPQLIAEEGDRPVKLASKLDILEAQPILSDELRLDTVVTQVTAFMPLPALRERIAKIEAAGVRSVVFVGVPRVFDQRDVVGIFPNDAVRIFADQIPERGVILIPTRPGELERFSSKLAAGATFGLTQLLFTDSIVRFLTALAVEERRPEILLSFGYVPNMETERGLIRWLIKDTTPEAQAEAETVARLAALPFRRKKAALVELVRRVVGPVRALGFPLSLHFECPYGASQPAMEAFGAVLDAWESELGSRPTNPLSS